MYLVLLFLRMSEDLMSLGNILINTKNTFTYSIHIMIHMFQRHTDIARPLAIIDFHGRTSKAISYRNGGQFKFIPPFWNENSSECYLLQPSLVCTLAKPRKEFGI